MATFLPVNLELLEFQGTAGTSVQIIPVVAVPPAIQDVLTITNVVTSGWPRVPEDLVITWTGDTFTFSSTFFDMFDKTIKYVIYDENESASTYTKTFYTAKKFTEVPSNQTGVWRYIPPSDEYMDLDFTVTATGTVSGTQTYTWTLTLRYNHTYCNAQFLNLVQTGTEFLNAKTIYPELN